MHKCPPPEQALDDWLESHSTTNDKFGHLLLEEKDSDILAILEALKPYFESAHFDARNVFHYEIGIDLHPDADGSEMLPIQYPNSLSSTSQRGLFGEVFAGLVTEHYDFVGNHRWQVPIFLFRFHQDARNYLFNLARNPDNQRQTMGRLGTDFVGIELDQNSAVSRFISGEAKWRSTLTPSVVETLMHGNLIDDPAGTGLKVRAGNGVWNEINNDPLVPHGVRQLTQLLKEHDPQRYDAAIFSMERALILRSPEPLPRTDLVIIVGNGGARRNPMECQLPNERMPEEYTAGHDLQLVEVYLEKGEDLIDALYQSLWQDEDNNG
jgi:hypothetical protein